MGRDFTEVVQTSFVDLSQGVVNILPELLIALILFILGLFLGNLVGKGVRQLLEKMRVNNLGNAFKMDQVAKRAGYRFDIAKLVGILFKWFIVIVFTIAALEVLGLAQINFFLQDVVNYLPNVIAAIIILLIGGLVAEALQNIVTASARSAGLSSASFLGVAARWVIWIFAAMAALAQLGVATYFIQTFFTGIIIAAALAFGLAFGLGGREVAGRYLEKMSSEISGRSPRRDDF